MIRYRHGGILVVEDDCMSLMAELDDNSIDAIVTDPPYALPGGFMGKSWDKHDGRENAGFAYWFMGLIDGEGHFGIKSQRGNNPTSTSVPFFSLKMRADEEATFKYILTELRFGQLQRENRGDANPMIRWVVQSKEDCQRLVDMIDKYGLRAKKRLDYALWREAVCEWADRPRGNRWDGPADDTRMRNLKSQMENVRAYADPPWSGHEFQDWCRMWAREALRVLKPGGHLLAFGGSRTGHRLACGIEDAGFEIRDTITWLYGSGFPKSHDISKAIDKAAGATREVTGRTATPFKVDAAGERGTSLHGSVRGDFSRQVDENGYRYTEITAPATDDARFWQGWGTALKPGYEPIVVARKPFKGPVAANVLAYGTGALNIDGTRVPGNVPATTQGQSANAGTIYGADQCILREFKPNDGGRWPANVVLSHLESCSSDVCTPGCPVAELDMQSGTLSGRIGMTQHSSPTNIYGEHKRTDRSGVTDGTVDSGGASRFFPTFRWQAKAPTRERPKVDDIAHPTVKPLALMQWLTRLVTPPSGLVLDPFAGSGTTVEACMREGFNCLAVEKSAEYIPLIIARIERA